MARCARLGGAFAGIIDFKGNLVELGDGVTADLAWGTIMVGNAFCPFLQATANNRGLMIHFADDQNRGDDA